MYRWWQTAIFVAFLLGLGGLVWDGLNAVLTLLAESAPYLLIGFVLAGMIKVVVPEHRVYRYLGGDHLTSVALASLLGIPIPLCSCSVLPVALSLRQSGASKGATTSFLISTPETGLDSIGITYALLDPVMTIARPVSAFVTALITGSLVNVIVRQGWDSTPDNTSFDGLHDACHEHDHDTITLPTEAAKRRPQDLGRDALAFAFGPLMDDLTPWLIIGFLVSGALVFMVPDGFFGAVVPAGWASFLLMLVLGTPVYICAAAATPVAVTLIAKGLDPGAALVLLLVGPATNATTMLVIARMLGKRIVALHLLGVTVCAVLLGAALNVVYNLLQIDLSVLVADVVHSSFTPLTIMATVLLLAVLVRSAIRIRLLSQWGAQLRRLCRPLSINPLSTTSRLTALAVVLLIYLLTAFSAIGPVETG